MAGGNVWIALSLESSGALSLVKWDKRSNRDDQASSRHSTTVRYFQMTEGLKDSLCDPKDPPPVDGSKKASLASFSTTKTQRTS